MDSHSFRVMARELSDLLEGARLEKIHGPHPGIFTFRVFAQGVKRCLVLRHERQAPALFFTEQRLSNPPRPSALVMRIRKYCEGRRLGRGVTDFVTRRIAFPLSAPPGQSPLFFVLDMVNGPSVLPALEDGFGAAPAWPDAALVDSLCATSWRKGEKTGPWQEYAVLTPFLRETLAALEPLEGRALMVDLEEGGPALFLYADASERPSLYSAWPLPEPLCARRALSPCPLEVDEEENQDAVFSPWQAPVASLLPAYPALASVALVDEPRFFAALGAAARKEEAAPERRASKKLARLLSKLDQEEQRLTTLLALRDDAKSLQEVLWRYPADAREAQVEVPDGQGGSRLVGLDPLLTVRENMIRMFRQSARGARGLTMLAQRRRDMQSEYGLEGENGGRPDTPGQRQPVEDEAPFASPGGARPMPPLSGRKEYKDVARFLSSDGFVLLRGKNAKGNHALLKIGSAHDLWLHAEDGPSAHLLIRRSHPAEEVPERTLAEAAILVGEKSWQRADARFRVMAALLRHVHAVKGAAPGTVRVDTVLQSLTVSPLLPQKEEDNS